MTCTITNDDQPVTLHVIKHVVNNNGGTRSAGQLTMNVSGTNVSNTGFAGAESPGTAVTLDAHGGARDRDGSGRLRGVGLDRTATPRTGSVRVRT